VGGWGRADRHWIRGSYLITEVKQGVPGAKLELPVDDGEELEMVRSRLGERLSIAVRGQRLRLVPGGDLAHLEDSPEALRAGLDALCEAMETEPRCLPTCLPATPPFSAIHLVAARG
jgi:hypothetical protein